MSLLVRSVTTLALVPTLFLGNIASAAGQATPSKDTSEELHPLPASLDQQFMDKTADPCVDFAQYSCGNFSKLYSIPNDMSSYGSLAIIYEHTQQALHALLGRVENDDPSRTPNEQKVGDFYATCVNPDPINTAGLAPLQPELDRIAALKTKSEIPPLLAHLQLINIAPFFSYGEGQDFKDASKQIVQVDQGGLDLPERDYYLRTGDAAEKTRQQYMQHIAKMMQLLGEPQAKAATDAQAIMQLETALAKVSLDVTSRREPQNVYHLMNISQLTTLTPEIAWPAFFQSTGVAPPAELNVASPEFFKGLGALLQSTDLDTLKTYLRWQLIDNIPRDTLPVAFGDERFNFYSRQLSGQPEQQARWKRCAATTDQALGEAVGQVYVKNYFPPESKAKTLQMVTDIESAMDQDIDTLEWMSSGTKIKSKRKLHLVAQKIGYPERWRDYSSLKIVRGDALGNSLRAAEFENRRQLAKIGKPVDRGEWGMSASTVNAYYNSSMNDINFPAAILQLPLFDPNSTDAENYGHVGAVIGHELTHGFDDEGRKFDGNGNLADWWTAEDAKNFEAKADCEVKEYGGFTVVDDIKLNGKLTLGENTADNGGLRLAYLAFLADAKRKGLDLETKHDGYTPVQQFFVAYAQNWCGAERPEQARLQAQTDPHSPLQFRIKGVVQNMSEFGKAFGCKSGQPMMPANACRVW